MFALGLTLTHVCAALHVCQCKQVSSSSNLVVQTLCSLRCVTTRAMGECRRKGSTRCQKSQSMVWATAVCARGDDCESLLCCVVIDLSTPVMGFQPKLGMALIFRLSSTWLSLPCGMIVLPTPFKRTHCGCLPIWSQAMVRVDGTSALFVADVAPHPDA